MNNNNDFMICSKDTYPKSIPLTAGCIENDKDTFLDSDITIEENRFITKIYHKVDDFDFEIVFHSLQVTCQTISHITHFILSWLDFLPSAQNLTILIFVVEIYWKVY